MATATDPSTRRLADRPPPQADAQAPAIRITLDDGTTAEMSAADLRLLVGALRAKSYQSTPSGIRGGL